MALLYKMRAIAQSDSSYVFWTDSEPDLDGSNAPESVVTDSIVIDSVGGQAEGGGGGGAPQYHDTTFSPVALWQFNGDLTDSSGNGFDLLTGTGTERYASLFTGFQMLNMNLVARRSINDSLLTLTGEWTIECLVSVPANETGADRTLISFEGGTEFENTNHLYNIRLNGSNNLENFCEYSTGANSFRATSIPQSDLRPIRHLAVTQSSDGKTNRFYIDGVFQEEVTATNAPTGGTNSRIGINGHQDNSARFVDDDGLIASVKIIASKLSDSEIASEYNRTLGPVYGTI